MDDTQALHFIGEPLCVGHADTGECEDRLVGETEGLGRGKVPAMTALVDEIGRGLHRILPSIITVIIATELAQRRKFTQNGDGKLEQPAHPAGIVTLVVAMFPTWEEFVAPGIGIGYHDRNSVVMGKGAPVRVDIVWSCTIYN